MPRAVEVLAIVEFDDFVLRTARELVQVAYLVLDDKQRAEDLVQECMVKLARRWPRVRRMRHPVAYARKILMRDVLREAERRDRQDIKVCARANASEQAGAIVKSCGSTA
jgi:DNA-directed RNA polymerase specialized sigma24 family protein